MTSKSSLEDRLPTAEPTGADAPFVRRAPRISQTDVFCAADELLVEGHRPTIDRVRMRLGRGSPNTINDHLDAWWARLGSRLRDLPGREFPQLPERIARALQHLWNEALEGAHETLQGTLIQHEQALAKQEEALQIRERELTEREQSVAARAGALEESLSIACEQLSAANRRAESLESVLHERDAEHSRLRARIELLERSSGELRSKLDAATTAYQSERAQLQEHYATTERRWLAEVDRARQGTRELAKEHDKAMKELRQQLVDAHTERDQLRDGLIESRAELRTTAAIRQQLEARLRARASPAAPPRPRPWKARPRSTGKPKR